MTRDLFSPVGVHVLADGQFGSCGKGALASWLAEQAVSQGSEFKGVITNAGPNSGHTSYFDDQKIVLKQLPTFAVHMALRGRPVPAYFSAGAVIDLGQLSKECTSFPEVKVFIHPQAAVLQESDRRMEQHIPSIAAVAGTRSGTGFAIVRKIMREPAAVYVNLPRGRRIWPMYSEQDLAPATDPYFMEVSQGFSLGINSHFYPKVTSRECTFMQGFADARVPLTSYSRGYLAFRTYPIRVGNVDDHSSGEWYSDQVEKSWGELGIEPERTTVTNRERRIATWSWRQFNAAMDANAPTHVFLNFLNYLPAPLRETFIIAHERTRNERSSFGYPSYDFIKGFGPTTHDIHYD